MNKYKVEFKQVHTYVVDVLAEDESKAKELAGEKFKEIQSHNVEHYHETEDPETEVSTVYDVTNTDDPFNP